MAKKITNAKRRTKVRNPPQDEQELTEKEAKKVKGGATIRKGGWVLDTSYGPGTSSITDGTSNTVLPVGQKT